jgi:hypothetical protein
MLPSLFCIEGPRAYRYSFGMKSFVATYNEGVTDGLAFPRTGEERGANIRIIKDRLEVNWAQLESATILEGLQVLSRQQLIGTLCVSGSDQQIEKLEAFLRERNLGAVMENKTMFRPAS